MITIMMEYYSIEMPKSSLIIKSYTSNKEEYKNIPSVLDFSIKLPVLPRVGDKIRFNYEYLQVYWSNSNSTIRIPETVKVKEIILTENSENIIIKVV